MRDVRKGEAVAAEIARATPGGRPRRWLALSPEVQGRSNAFWVDRAEKACQFRGEKDEERMWSVCEEYVARGSAFG